MRKETTYQTTSLLRGWMIVVASLLIVVLSTEEYLRYIWIGITVIWLLISILDTVEYYKDKNIRKTYLAKIKPEHFEFAKTLTDEQLITYSETGVFTGTWKGGGNKQ